MKIYDVYKLQDEIEKRINKKFKDNKEHKSLIEVLKTEATGNGCVDYYFPSYSSEHEEKFNIDDLELTNFEKEVLKTLDQICKEKKIKDCMKIYIWW